MALVSQSTNHPIPPLSLNILTTAALPSPPPIPAPWTWQCCGTRNTIANPRCLECGRRVQTTTESVGERRVRMREWRNLRDEKAEIREKSVPMEGRDGPLVAVIESRIRQVRAPHKNRHEFDAKGWFHWRHWRQTCEAIQELEQSHAEEEEEFHSVPMRASRIYDRQQEIKDLTKMKKKDWRERMMNGTGHCERDCGRPTDCYRVLRLAARREAEAKKDKKRSIEEVFSENEEEDMTTKKRKVDDNRIGKLEEKTKSKKRKAENDSNEDGTHDNTAGSIKVAKTITHTTPSLPQTPRPREGSESWYPQRGSARDDDDGEDRGLSEEETSNKAFSEMVRKSSGFLAGRG